MHGLTLNRQLETHLTDDLLAWANTYPSKYLAGLVQSKLFLSLLLADSDTALHFEPIRDASEFSEPLHAKSYLRLYRKAFILNLLTDVFINSLAEEECLVRLSLFADQCIRFAATFSQQFWEKKYGKQPTFLVLALGKLGGSELNFSSDIDLMFTYLDRDSSQLEASDCQSFFKRVAALFIQLLDEVTVDGRVFRVDMRLRPFGDSGPLVLNFKSFEAYYQEHGRGWERYALQKMRVVTGQPHEQKKIYSVILPFVYRKYLDYSVFEVLRTLRSLINQEIKQKSLRDDVKRGTGGIREIEFICQSLQLIHGGKNKALRENSLLASIDKLRDEKLLKQEEAVFLKDSYLFLRKLENRLQMFNDKQTHALPQDEIDKLRICFAMGCESWESFRTKLEKIRSSVHQFFLSMIEKDDADNIEETHKPYQELTALWQQHLTMDSASDLLTTLGFNEPLKVFQELSLFSGSNRLLRLSPAARVRLDNFIPLTFVLLSKLTEPDRAFFRVIKLIDAIVRRSSYFALLTENKQALERVLVLFSKSKWIAELVTEKPFLLETLLENPDSWNAENLFLEDKEMSSLTQEEAMENLRSFKYQKMLQIACLEVDNKVSPIIACNLLSRLAEVCLKKAIRYLSLRHEELPIQKDFMVVAYGRFAGSEMSYDSDLDLIFLYFAEKERHDSYIKFVKKLIQFLSLSTASGYLYQVDPRLRPSGSSGLLVSDLKQFEEYQCEKAWTWEHQALIRSKVVYGQQDLQEKFAKIRAKALCQVRDEKTLKSEIIEMRQKISDHKGSSSKSLKLSSGGIVDLEFILQFLILQNAHQFPEVVNCIGVLSQLEALRATVSPLTNELNTLQKSYLSIKEAEQAWLLQSRKKTSLEAAKMNIQQLWSSLLCN